MFDIHGLGAIGFEVGAKLKFGRDDSDSFEHEACRDWKALHLDWSTMIHVERLYRPRHTRKNAIRALTETRVIYVRQMPHCRLHIGSLCAFDQW